MTHQIENYRDTTVNLTTLDDAKTAFTNSGWFERFGGDDTDSASPDVVGRYLRHHSGGHITEAELNNLLSRFAVDVLGWTKRETYT